MIVQILLQSGPCHQQPGLQLTQASCLFSAFDPQERMIVRAQTARREMQCIPEFDYGESLC